MLENYRLLGLAICALIAATLCGDVLPTPPATTSPPHATLTPHQSATTPDQLVQDNFNGAFERRGTMPVQVLAPVHPPAGNSGPVTGRLLSRQIRGPSEEVYYGLAGEIAKTIAPSTEADPIAILSQLLVAFGNSIGRKAHFVHGRDRHFTNLFIVLVGRSSRARKGTSWGYVESLMQPVDPKWLENRTASGLSTGEGLVWAVHDPIVADDGTVADPGVSDKRLLARLGEFAAMLLAMQRLGNTLSPFLRDAWDSGRIGSWTKTSLGRAKAAHISMVAHTTFEEVDRYLTATEAASGFANRFLWLWVERAHLLPLGGPLDEQLLACLMDKLKQAHTFASTVGQMAFDDAAAKLWANEYGELTADYPGLLGAIVSRAEAQVTRLACLYALLDWSAVIGEDHLRAALALWDYCFRSACHIFGQKYGNPLADKVEAALRARPEGLTRSEIHALLGNNQTAGQISKILSDLEAAGKVRRDRRLTGGRPAEYWIWIGEQP